MQIKLVRFFNAPDKTIGQLYVGTRKYYTIEPGYKGNLPEVSCIPDGIYKMGRYNSGRFGETWRVRSVPGRTGILFHAGNHSTDTRGCILPGLGMLEDFKGVSKSRTAMNQILAILEGHEDAQLFVYRGHI